MKTEKGPTILPFEEMVDYFRSENATFVCQDFILFDNSFGRVFFSEYMVTDCVMITIFRKGIADFEINFVDHHIEAPAITCILPNSVFGNYKETDDIHSDTLLLRSNWLTNSSFLPTLDLLIRLATLRVLKKTNEKMTRLTELIEQIIHYESEKSPLNDLNLISLLYSLLVSILNDESLEILHKEPSIRGHNRDIAYNFYELLWNGAPIIRGVGFYADKLNMSSKYLSFIIKDVTGRSAIKWINYAIIFRAKQMLYLTDKTIREVSEKLGFDSAPYFIFFFKRETGLTPLRYRKNRNTA